MKKTIFVLLDACQYEAGTRNLGYLEHLIDYKKGAKYKVKGELPSLSRPMYATLLTGTPVFSHGITTNDTLRTLDCDNVFSLCQKQGGKRGRTLQPQQLARAGQQLVIQIKGAVHIQQKQTDVFQLAVVGHKKVLSCHALKSGPKKRPAVSIPQSAAPCKGFRRFAPKAQPGLHLGGEPGIMKRKKPRAVPSGSPAHFGCRPLEVKEWHIGRRW